MNPQTVAMPRWYEVVSPEYMTHDGGSYEPPEYGRDWLPVQATSKRRAKVLAVRAWRRRGRGYVTDDPGANPFTDLTVNRIEPCPHGVLCCLPCAECEAEWLADDLADLGEETP
jgi:hypothetical protein